MIRIAFNFNNPIWSDVELCARWSLDSYVVILMSDGAIYDVLHVDHGGLLAQPDDPVRDGYAFLGWYSDETYTKEFDFNEPIMGDITVYIKWEQMISPPSTGIFGHDSSTATVSVGVAVITVAAGMAVVIRRKLVKK